MAETKLNQCAILLLSLGEDLAAEVFKHLTTREVQAVGKVMSSLKKVTRSDVEAVLEAFHQDVEQMQAVTLGSDEYVRAVLTKALGSARADKVLDDILEANQEDGLDALNWLDAPNIAELIANEHPQVIATILVHLERARASEVLVLLPERLRNDVLVRIATFGGVQPAALGELTDVLNDALSGQSVKRSKIGGVRTAAEILNFVSHAEEEHIIENLRTVDADLTQRIVDEMFVFDNLATLEDRSVQLILKEVESSTLTIALKGAPEELRAKVFKNMSSRAAEMLREEIEMLGPVRMSKVEEEQKAILQIVRRLAEEGQITLGGGNDEYV